MDVEVGGELKRSMVRVVGWDSFPKDLGMEILARLPLECVYGYRRVSHEWNALLSSTYFLTEKWAEAPIHNKPSLILCYENLNMNCMVFSFHTWNWKPGFSLSFLNQLPCVSSKRGSVRVNCRDSAAGLVLVDFVTSGQETNERVPSLHSNVFNPYTRMSVPLDHLPIGPASDTIATCIVVDENNNRSDACKVVALGRRCVTRDESKLFVEICDCSERRWETMGCLPDDLLVLPELILLPKWKAGVNQLVIRH